MGCDVVCDLVVGCGEVGDDVQCTMQTLCHNKIPETSISMRCIPALQSPTIPIRNAKSKKIMENQYHSKILRRRL